MPLYDFRCQECETLFEENLTLQEKEAGVKPQCPNCSSHRVQQVFIPLGYVKKGGSCAPGSGFG